MDCYKILAYLAIGCLLFGDRVSAYYNQTYGVYSFILSDISADNSQEKTAQVWCSRYNGSGYSLATIPNKDVQSNVEQFLDSAVSNLAMRTTDLSLIILNGKLNTSLPGIWIWVNEKSINGVSVKDQRDPSQVFFYGFLYTKDYQIHASAANNGRPFICEKPGSASDCVAGLSLNGRCYQVKSSSLSWYSARNDCLDGGGDLASFETLTDNTFNSTIGTTLLAKATQTEYWVGMQRAEWRWNDTGPAIKYTNWESGYPNNAYACLSIRFTSEWMWYTYECSTTYRFICMATNVPPTISTSSDASQSKSTTDSLIFPPSSHNSAEQPSSNTSSSSLSSKQEGLGFGQGIGVGVGIGLAVMIIVLVIIFVVQHFSKRRQNEADAAQESTPQQLSTIYSTDPIPDKSYEKIRVVKTTESTEDNYEPLH